MSDPPTLADGFVAPEVRDEFPGLRLRYLTVAQRPRASPPVLAARLRSLSDRYHGANVVSMRTKPVPHAFRSFYRQIGLDPDVRRIPSERVAVDRLLHGGFQSTGLIADACLVALIETGVPVWALDADVVDDAGLGIRTCATADARRHPELPALTPGGLVIADGRAVHAELFAEPPTGHGVGPRTQRVTLFTIAVDGVPEIHVEEALWVTLDLLGAGTRG